MIKCFLRKIYFSIKLFYAQYSGTVPPIYIHISSRMWNSPLPFDLSTLLSKARNEKVLFNVFTQSYKNESSFTRRTWSGISFIWRAKSEFVGGGYFEFESFYECWKLKQLGFFGLCFSDNNIKNGILSHTFTSLNSILCMNDDNKKTTT